MKVIREYQVLSNLSFISITEIKRGLFKMDNKETCLFSAVQTT